MYETTQISRRSHTIVTFVSLLVMSDHVLVDGAGEASMFIAVTAGGISGVVGSGSTGIDMAVSPFTRWDLTWGCSTLLSRSLSAFKAICLKSVKKWV